MTLPDDPAAGRQPARSRHKARCPASWPILAASAALLAGDVALVLVHKAGVTFLVIFVSSTAILVLVIAESGHGLLAMTVRRGLAKLRELRSPLARPDLWRAVARMRHRGIIGHGFMPKRRHI
jgi:hypothetical protein